MNVEFQETKARKIINVHKHVDGPWFWDKYSAHPYIGCSAGCLFCYLRGGNYLGRRDPETFDSLIQVKTNAVELLERELGKLKPDVIACGDWQQPAEDRYQLSRAMLQVLSEHDFPLFVVERSPLILRDLDFLQEVNRRSSVCVVFSISSMDPVLKATFEPRSAGVQRRLQAMQQLSEAGIQVGTALMPVLPLMGDDETHLEEVVIATRDHGGSFVLVGGMSMAGVQAQYTLEGVRSVDPELEPRLREFYQWQEGGKPEHSPPRSYTIRLGRQVRKLCDRHGISDRIPRYIAPGTLAVNKWVAEKLFLKTYDLELEGANPYRIWAHRKAAWLVDELEESVSSLYYAGGERRLQELPGIGRGLASEIAGWVQVYERQNAWRTNIH